MDLGIFSRRNDGGQISSTEVIAGALSLVWLVGITLFFVFTAGSGNVTPEGTPRVDSLRFVIMMIAVFMPVALIWVAAAAAKSSRIMREESARLQTAVNAMRHAYIQQQQSGVVELKPAVERKLEEIAAAQRRTDAALAMFTSGRAESERLLTGRGAATQPVAEPPSQPSLALGGNSEPSVPPLGMTDFIRALNFPESPDDKEGFRTLRRALQDHGAAQLIHAAQDVLTLLSQEGIYMDDLQPDHARPEIWRRFARGERGKPVALLGGIRDRSSLALAAARMRNDTIFRDAVHHFLRKFDHGFTEFEQVATDQDIADLADTRSARAFMLMGRVTGTFD